ncbi:hypothetical protein [Enterococcus sp. AZ072]|uniref:hypothetical protein n=1 Tax=unclassified Enterococcus TaxID=2608891 RepID=UPI003D283BAD
MAELEKDFMLRQAKDLAKGLGKFLEQESIDEILQMDQASNQKQPLDQFIENELERFKEEQEAASKDSLSGKT